MSWIDRPGFGVQVTRLKVVKAHRALLANVSHLSEMVSENLHEKGHVSCKGSKKQAVYRVVLLAAQKARMSGMNNQRKTALITLFSTYFM